MRILAATGGAEHSDKAIRLAGLIQQMTAGELCIITVLGNEIERVQAEAILRRAKSLVPTNHIKTCVRVGNPADEIVLEAKSNRSNLIVVGERTQHGLARRLLAPTTERIISKMPCPVLIARGQDRLLQSLLVCESGRNPSLLSRLIDHLSPILNQADEITVLHVMSQMVAAPGVPDWELQADAQALMEKHTPEGTMLEKDLARLKRFHVRLRAKIRHGLVVQEILTESQGEDYDMVVIGAHLGKGWERFLLDDLAHELICHTDRPLLVI